jgi:hypothetical protein
MKDMSTVLSPSNTHLHACYSKLISVALLMSHVMISLVDAQWPCPRESIISWFQQTRVEDI